MSNYPECITAKEMFDPTINRVVHKLSCVLARTRTLLNAKYKIAGYGGTFFSFDRAQQGGTNPSESVNEMSFGRAL